MMAAIYLILTNNIYYVLLCEKKAGNYSMFSVFSNTKYTHTHTHTHIYICLDEKKSGGIYTKIMALG